MKRIALAAACSVFFSLLANGAAAAAAIDLDIGEPAHAMRIDRAAIAVPVSELPEPEVFAMMVVGLILIGYRASRDSSEKFK